MLEVLDPFNLSCDKAKAMKQDHEVVSYPQDITPKGIPRYLPCTTSYLCNYLTRHRKIG